MTIKQDVSVSGANSFPINSTVNISTDFSKQEGSGSELQIRWFGIFLCGIYMFSHVWIYTSCCSMNVFDINLKLCFSDRDSRTERERIRLFREREERERLSRKRDWLESEKRQLETDRMEREFLERMRMRVEYERKREQERIDREREELRRQQEQLRFDQERRPLKRPFDMDSRC